MKSDSFNYGSPKRSPRWWLDKSQPFGDIRVRLSHG